MLSSSQLDTQMPGVNPFSIDAILTQRAAAKVTPSTDAASSASPDPDSRGGSPATGNTQYPGPLYVDTAALDMTNRTILLQQAMVQHLASRASRMDYCHITQQQAYSPHSPQVSSHHHNYHRHAKSTDDEALIDVERLSPASQNTRQTHDNDDVVTSDVEEDDDEEGDLSVGESMDENHLTGEKFSLICMETKVWIGGFEFRSPL